MPTLEEERGALRRLAHRRLPSPRVARLRAAVKRRLRRAGLAPDPCAPSRDLIRMALTISNEEHRP